MKYWILRASSESGDDYGSKLYNHKPTKQDKIDYAKNETPEEIQYLSFIIEMVEYEK